jgi:hypothetical protein
MARQRQAGRNVAWLTVPQAIGTAGSAVGVCFAAETGITDAFRYDELHPLNFGPPVEQDTTLCR